MTAHTPARRAAKRANKARAEAARDAIIEKLRAGGASCSTCSHYGQRVAGLTNRPCMLKSDFEGYVTMHPMNLCSQHAMKQIQ